MHAHFFFMERGILLLKILRILTESENKSNSIGSFERANEREERSILPTSINVAEQVHH